MLGWYLEDYAEFVKECDDNLQSIKTNKENDIINGIAPNKRDWSDTLIKLAANQSTIAAYMAQQAGVEE